LPVYLSCLRSLSCWTLWIFYLANLLFVVYCFKKNQGRIYQLRIKIQDLKERINLLRDERTREFKNKIALHNRITRYGSLKNIIEELSQNLDLESVADALASISFSLIANNRGVCILYLVDKKDQPKLSLFKAKKEHKNLFIKAKEGDIFDFWVLRQGVPLLIEDIKKDFRFDLEKLKTDDIRPVSALVAVPLVSENRFLGILRLDHPDIGFYSQDDLRFLVTICDLGVVALENGELFKKTQDLAVHDELTSLYTKGYFLERLKEECKRSMRQGRVFSLLMLDIDHFKNYNDKLGHMAGDIVLKTVSQVIVQALAGANPIVSRFGGEEFCIAILGADKKKAYALSCELLVKVEKTKIILRKQESNVTISVGVATFLDDARDENELIFKADRAMYDAKQKGRNRVAVSA